MSATDSDGHDKDGGSLGGNRGRETELENDYVKATRTQGGHRNGTGHLSPRD